MRHIPDASGESLILFVCDTVVPGSVVYTDGWAATMDYLNMSSPEKLQSNHLQAPPPCIHAGVHRIASLLKRWILGTHQGSVVPEHLQAYLEEFTFRFNRRTSRSRGLVFRRLLERRLQRVRSLKTM
jgi:hypothetical protein